MNIKSDITRDDYKAFLRYVARSVSAMLDGEQFVRILIGVAVGLGMGYALSLLRLSSHPSSGLALLCGLFAGAFCALTVLSRFSRRQMRRMSPADDSYMLGPQETVIEDGGIRQRSAYHEAVFQWSLVRAIGLTDQHIFIMVDRIAGIILPKRAFSSDAECEQFVSEIERRSNKVRSRVLPNTTLEPTTTAPLVSDKP